MTKNYHVLLVKHIGQTNHRPARVRIISERFKQSVLLSYDNEIASNSPALETAEKWLTACEFVIIGKAEGKEHYYIISETFKPLKP